MEPQISLLSFAIANDIYLFISVVYRNVMSLVQVENRVWYLCLERVRAVVSILGSPIASYLRTSYVAVLIFMCYLL